jgi:hypothetical protein
MTMQTIQLYNTNNTRNDDYLDDTGSITTTPIKSLPRTPPAVYDPLRLTILAEVHSSSNYSPAFRTH